MKTENETKNSISVVIPVYNEEECLEGLYEELKGVLYDTDLDYEIIFVDDGSRDNTPDILRDIATNDQLVTVIQLGRNFGQTAAISAGIDHTRGDIIVLMDGDLQNDPADIPILLEKLEEGYDLVSGWRKNRKDPWINRRLPSMIANALISKVTGVHLHDYGCTLKVYRRKILTEFRLYGEMHRFLPAYAEQMGARITELTVNHRPRVHGKSKYGLKRTLKVILDLFTVKFLSTYSTKPIYLFGSVGCALALGAFIVFAYLVAEKLLHARPFVESPLLLMVVMLFLLGFQSIFMGLIAELLIRTYHEAQNKPTYVVRQVIKKD